MNLGVVGNIEDYLDDTDDTYISASLVRYVENENETKGHRCDANYISALQNELEQGVYMNKTLFNNLEEDEEDE